MIAYLNHILAIRVASLSYELATFLNLPDEEKNSIYKSALFLDLGKNKIDLAILNKPSKLTKKEFDLLKEHTNYGYDLALKLGLNRKEGLYILCHHENYDGTGYPIGLSGKVIPLGARIIKICDVFDALTSDREYRKRLDISEAINVMNYMVNEFDPYIYKKFKCLLDLENNLISWCFNIN